MKTTIFIKLLVAASLGLLFSVGAVAATVSPPQFASQQYGGLVIVSMTTATSGAAIRYTTNGTEPTVSSAVYSSPLSLFSTTTLKAKAFKNGLTPSSVTSATYTVFRVVQISIEVEHSALDGNPNAGGGLRIFPERIGPSDTNFRDSVIVTATISPIAPNVEVDFRRFDPDDPSSNSSPLDPNGQAGNDNLPDVTGARPGPGVLSSPSARTDKFGKASVRLTVSWQPGNNFIVAATTDPFYANGLRLRVVDGSVIEDSSGISLTDARARAKQTPMLTVWRRVHVEVDRMANVTGNSVNGVLAGVVANSSRRGQSTLDLGLNLPAPGPFGTEGLAKRFEGGTITIQINGANTTFGVVTNTAAITGNDKVVVSGIVPAEAIGKDYKLVDDDAAHGFGDGAVIPFPNTGRLVTCFAPAYVLPVFDLPNPTPVVPFVLNTPGNSASDLLSLYRFDNIKYEKQETFWVVYILGAIQGTVNEDGDPDDSNGDERPDEPGGIALGNVDALNGVGAVIYLEGANEAAGGKRMLTNATGTGEQDLVVHKVGHLFGAEHIDGGIMSRSSTVFSLQSLKKIRQARHP